MVKKSFIITKTPFRFCLGGGVDIRPYYSQFKGFALSGTINHFIKIIISPRKDRKIGLQYCDQSLIVDQLSKIPNPIIKESLKLTQVHNGIDIISLADVPPQSGLGSSGAFAVGLLNALHAFKGETPSSRELAEEACFIEMDLLQCPSGKQDQYLAAFGGLVALQINRRGRVRVEPLKISKQGIQTLGKNLLVFDTGIRRQAGKVLEHHQKNQQITQETAQKLHNFKKVGLKIKRALEKEDFDAFGCLLGELWMRKKAYSAKVTNKQIDQWYNTAKRSGALGGKIMGAGGGGFFVFYVPEKNQKRFKDKMKKAGLSQLNYQFWFTGSQVIVNV